MSCVFTEIFAIAGENIEVAAKRELLEETGIHADFKCLISFRHGHDYVFGCSDIYMIAYLTPQDLDVKKCQQEISECRWMKVKTVLHITKHFFLYHEKTKRFEILIILDQYT